jgi:hypothetical protein
LQDNVALIAVLEMAPDPERSSKQLICVANTHIHANPELNDVKLWQVHTLLKGLEKIANRCAAAKQCCVDDSKYISAAAAWATGMGNSGLLLMQLGYSFQRSVSGGWGSKVAQCTTWWRRPYVLLHPSACMSRSSSSLRCDSLGVCAARCCCCCSADIPMLVAGDFNSIPGSAAHSLLVKGRVEPQQLVSTGEQT